jgi:hypothetical protein
VIVAFPKPDGESFQMLDLAGLSGYLLIVNAALTHTEF